MKYKIKILPSAWDDLKTIQDYYSIQFDIRNAPKVSSSILNTMERLESFPDSSSLTPDPWLNEFFEEKSGDIDEYTNYKERFVKEIYDKGK